jgi:hypothetical protein
MPSLRREAILRFSDGNLFGWIASLLVRRPPGAGKGIWIMESAAELHEARILRAEIEIREAMLQAAAPEERVLLAEEIARLKRDYRRALARQADADYRRRRAEWRAEQDGAAPARACA